MYNFLDIPTVQSREPLWTDPPDTPVISGLDVTKRQVLITTTLDAVPDHRFDLASESIIPFLLAVATAFFWLAGGIFNPWYAVWGSIAIALLLIVWFWSARFSKKLPQRRHRAARLIVT